MSNAPATAPLSPLQTGRRRRRLGDPSFRVIVTGAAGVLLAALGLLVVLTTRTALPFFQAHTGEFLTSSTWSPDNGFYGALAFVYGTVVSAVLALILAVPVSLGIALFLNEVAPPRARRPLIYLVELLAAVPSVVYGLWGIVILVPHAQVVWTAIANVFGFIPLFGGPAFGQSIATAAVILSLMILPIVTAISREALSLVPFGQREAALGLGATRWEMIWHALIPYARGGIVGGIVLGLGRAMGETIAVALVIGSFPGIPRSIFKPGYTMASVIANQFPEATGTAIPALFAIGILLFAITIVVNICAQLIVRRSVRALA
jgi:phosphate transport system permease protein